MVYGSVITLVFICVHSLLKRFLGKFRYLTHQTYNVEPPQLCVLIYKAHENCSYLRIRNHSY